MKKKFISGKDLPMRPPLLLTCVVYLMLEHFQANDYFYGGFCILGLILWAAWFYFVFNSEPERIFKD